MGTSNRRIAEVIEDVEQKRLIVRPFFQRRLVWTNSDKENFIDTVLKNYPFPEIFVATETLELDGAVKRRTSLVDGQQRITTLLDYVQGSESLLYKSIPRFAALDKDGKTRFLDYEMAVRDLGTVNENVLREIFRRINSTDYALKSMEVLNALFAGRYNQYCEALSRNPFFESHNVFPKASKKRMYDLTFCVILVTTLLAGYYRRNELNEAFLQRYNDDFPDEARIQAELDRTFDFIEQCEFGKRSRAWKQTDLFTLIVEVHAAIVVRGERLDPGRVGATLRAFYDEVTDLYKAKVTAVGHSETSNDAMLYLKHSTKATSDKYARIQRSEVIARLIRRGADPQASSAEAIS